MTDLSRERYRRDRPPVVTPYSTTGPPAFVGKVVTAAAAGQYMTVTPYAVAGTESQGSVGVYTSAGSNLLVLNVGPGTPAAGDYLVCRWSSWRWVAGRKGSTVCQPYTITVQDCDGNAVIGASVTGTDGTNTVGPATTNTFGRVSLTPAAAGSWTFTSSASGQPTISGTITVNCASGGTLLLSFKAFAPATATLTTGGDTYALTRFVSGSSYTYNGGTGTYPTTSYFTDPSNPCLSTGHASMTFQFGCSAGSSVHGSLFTSCSGSQTFKDPASSSGAGSVTMAPTITTFSVTPFLITGTWPAYWNGNSALTPYSPYAGQSFTVS